MEWRGGGGYGEFIMSQYCGKLWTSGLCGILGIGYLGRHPEKMLLFFLPPPPKLEILVKL